MENAKQVERIVNILFTGFGIIYLTVVNISVNLIEPIIFLYPALKSRITMLKGWKFLVEFLLNDIFELQELYHLGTFH